MWTRTIPAEELTLWRESGQREYRGRIRRRGDVAWTNLSNTLGGDWVLGVRADVNTPDQPAASFDLRLIRRAAEGTLSPGISSAPINQDAQSALRPLLHPGREVEVHARIRGGSHPWRLWLKGEVATAEWPDDEVLIRCRTMDGVLLRAQITEEVERGADDPGTPLATEIQGLLDEWWPGADVPVLRVIGDPELGIGRYKTPIGSLGAHIRTLAQRIGWDVRHLWSEPDQTYRLTLYLPPRDKTTPDFLLPIDEVADIPALSQSDEWVRNQIIVPYVTEVGGAEQRVVVDDAASIAEYRRQPMIVPISEGNQVPASTAQATALGNYALHDLGRPLVEARYRHTRCLPWLELHDVIAVQADGARFDQDRIFSVVGGSHEVTADGEHTELELRGGSPVGAVFAWWRFAGASEPATILVEYASDNQGSNASDTFNPAIHTYARWSHDGGSTWTEWFKIVGEDGASSEGRYVDFIFRTSPDQPPTPVGEAPAGWFDAPPVYDPEATQLWMSRAERDGATGALLSTWSVPVPMTGARGPQGPQGPPGESAEVRYSGPQPGENVSTSFDPQIHVYMQTRTTGEPWPTSWARIVGEAGQPGEDGRYTDYIFRVSNTQPDTPTGMAPAGWHDAPPPHNPDAGEYLWMSSAERTEDGSLLTPWSEPVRLTGERGPQGQAGAPGADGRPAIMALLDNDSVTIPTAEDGSGGVYAHAHTTIRVLEGASDVSGLWSYSASPSAGVTGSLSGRTYTVTAMSEDSGYVDITATRSGYPSLTVRFALAKAKGGAKGDPSTAYWLITDASAVKRSRTGAYTPASLVVSGRSATGESAPVPYAGRFQIATLSGTTWTTRYTSSTNQSSYSYTIPANIDAIRVRLYAAGGTSLLLDEEVVPVVEDGEDATAYRMIVDVAAVKRDEDGAYTPTSITASARSATGSAPPAPYPARFIVTTRTATAGWVNRYTSSGDESEITWGPIPPNTALIRIRLYRGGGVPTVERMLDEVIIPVIDESVAVTPVGFGHVGRAPSTTVGADLTNVVATVLDDDDRIGVLYAWVNSDGYADPDPSGPADGYIEVQPSGGSATVTDEALWQLTGGGSARLFRDLRISADQGKTITLEYVADDGETTGQQSFYLHSWAQIRDHALGEILPDAIKHSWQLAKEIRPPVVLPSLPSGNPDDLNWVYVDGLLYKWEGGAWEPVVNTTDLDGEIGEDQIADAAVTAEKIRDASVGLTKFASGMRPVEVVAALPTSGNTVGRTVVLTTDGKLYRYTSSGWTAAVPTSDLTGEVGEDLIADAAVTADKIRSGAVGLAKFATGIRPVEIVSSLPTSGNTVGRTVVLTGDGKLYRYTSSGWSSAVPTGDLTGEITSTQIADDAITTPKIAAGAVQADHLDANSVTAGKIAAGAVGAGEIAAGAVQAEHIRVGSRMLPLANPSVTGASDGWPLGVVGVTNRFGSTVTALESETDGNLLRYSEWIDIDPTKTYEVRASLRSIQGHSGATDGGILYFGLQAENAAGTLIAVTPFNPATRAFGTATDNPYFWSGGLGSGAWRDMVAYIIGANADAAEVRAGKNVTSHYRLPPTAQRIRLRWLNWSNGGVIRRAYLWSPTLTPVDATLIHGDGIVANSITTNKLAFTAVETGEVIAAINASDETLRIQGARIRIDGNVQFGTGYDPTTKETPDGAQAKANAAQTAAINAAAADAESKASAAQAAAEATAATLAEQEAEAARLAAIDAASGDASTKAAAAQAAAEATAALLAEQESEAARLAAIAASLDKATYLTPSTTTIDGGRITTGSVEADQLAANSVITGKIAAGAVKADEIDARAVGTQHLRIGSPALMLNNPSVSGHAEGWPLGVVGATNRFGATVTALESETDGNLQRFSEWIDIDPTKTYEVRGSLRSIQGHSGATDGGILYLGIQAENASGSLLQVIPFDVITRQFGSGTTNGYFWSGGLGSGAWRDVVGYILGENVDEADVRQGKNAARHFRLPATARRVRLQWLNWSNGGVTRRAYLWSPTITPVDATLIHGDGIVTGSITTEKLAFTAVETGNVVAAINASSEGLRIQGERIRIDGQVQFGTGYDPTTKETPTGAQSKANAAQTAAINASLDKATYLSPSTTTIDGGKITTGTVDADRLNVNAAWIGALSAGVIGVGQRTLIGDGVIVTDMIASEQIVADHISVTTLSEIIDPNGAPLGIVVSGLLRNAANTHGLNLDATGFQSLLYAPHVNIQANGQVTLGNHLTIGTQGNATFSGNLSAASGTFSGELTAASGTFAGTVSGNQFTADVANFSGDMFTQGSVWIPNIGEGIYFGSPSVGGPGLFRDNAETLITRLLNLDLTTDAGHGVLRANDSYLGPPHFSGGVRVGQALEVRGAPALNGYTELYIYAYWGNQWRRFHLRLDADRRLEAVEV